MTTPERETGTRPLGKLLVLNDTGLYVVELAQDVPAVAMLMAELTEQRAEVARLTEALEKREQALREITWAIERLRDASPVPGAQETRG